MVGKKLSLVVFQMLGRAGLKYSKETHNNSGLKDDYNEEVLGKDSWYVIINTRLSWWWGGQSGTDNFIQSTKFVSIFTDYSFSTPCVVGIVSNMLKWSKNGKTAMPCNYISNASLLEGSLSANLDYQNISLEG